MATTMREYEAVVATIAALRARHGSGTLMDGLLQACAHEALVAALNAGPDAGKYETREKKDDE